MAQHVRVDLGPQAGGASEVPQAPDCRMAVHPGTAAVEQDRPAVPEAGGPVDGPADRGRQRNWTTLLRLHTPQDPVAVLLAEVGDVRR